MVANMRPAALVLPDCKGCRDKHLLQVSELLPAKEYYIAEGYHQQYLEKGGRAGNSQSAAKGCQDKIRCYG